MGPRSAASEGAAVLSQEARIGLMTIALVCMAYLANSFRESDFLRSHRQFDLLFTQVHGLRVGDPVTIGGVPSGRVLDIDFAASDVQQALQPLTGGIPLIRARVELDGRTIPKESTYTVHTDLNGRRWLDITVSPSDEVIGPDENFFAETSSSQEDQLQITLRTFTELTSDTQDLRDELTDPQFRLQTKDAASNLRFYSRELAAASAQAPEYLDSLKEQIDKQETLLYAKMADFSEKTAEISARMREMTPQMSENLRGWTQRLERQREQLTTTLEMAVLRTEEYRDLVDRVMEQQLSEDALKKLIVELRSWSRKLEEYRLLAEDLHTLTSDPQVQQELKSLVGYLLERSQELRDRIESLERLVDLNPWLGGATSRPRVAPAEDQDPEPEEGEQESLKEPEGEASTR